MAATSVCSVAKFSFGNIQGHVFSVTVGANKTMAFDTGMRPILWHMWSTTSATTTISEMQCIKNKLAAGTAAAGFIALSSCTNGDDITVISWGK